MAGTQETSQDEESGYVTEARQLAAETIEQWGDLNEDEQLANLSEIVHQLASAENGGSKSKSKTMKEQWEENNNPFNYQPPDDPPELWSSEDYTELYDRVINMRVEWVCQKCNQPFGTLERARQHVQSKHQERLLYQAKSKAGYADKEDMESTNSSQDKNTEERRKANSQLSEWERDAD